MFGQNNDDQQQPEPQTPVADAGVLNAAMPDPITPTLTPPAGFNIPAAQPEPEAPSTDMSAPELPIPEPASPTPTTDDSTEPTSSDSGSDDLVSIKQQALQHLSPLVSHLDQTPEEKFRTTMMMIQASDNKDLIKDAFEAAQGITDDKARAQALLDVINEINYFTQHEA
jgi:hypothetical protein